MDRTDYFTYGAVEAVYDPLQGLYRVYERVDLGLIGTLWLFNGPGWVLWEIKTNGIQWDELRSIADMLEDLNAELEYESACGVNMWASGAPQVVDPRKVTCQACLRAALEKEFQDLREIMLASKWSTAQYRRMRHLASKWSTAQYRRMRHLEMHLDRGDVVCKCYE